LETEQKTETTKTAKSSAATKVKEIEVQADTTSAKKQSFVYLGPSLKTLPLRHGATYVGGIPKAFQDIYDNNADVRFLFVDLLESLEVRRGIRDEGSEYWLVYKLIEESGV
jgi:hypothetical protein